MENKINELVSCFLNSKDVSSNLQEINNSEYLDDWVHSADILNKYLIMIEVAEVLMLDDKIRDYYEKEDLIFITDEKRLLFMSLLFEEYELATVLHTLIIRGCCVSIIGNIEGQNGIKFSDLRIFDLEYSCYEYYKKNGFILADGNEPPCVVSHTREELINLCKEYIENRN